MFRVLRIWVYLTHELPFAEFQFLAPRTLLSNPGTFVSSTKCPQNMTKMCLKVFCLLQDYSLKSYVQQRQPPHLQWFFLTYNSTDYSLIFPAHGGIRKKGLEVCI